MQIILMIRCNCVEVHMNSSCFLANVVAISAHYTYKQSDSSNVSCSSFDLVNCDECRGPG